MRADALDALARKKGHAVHSTFFEKLSKGNKREHGNQARVKVGTLSSIALGLKPGAEIHYPMPTHAPVPTHALVEKRCRLATGLEQNSGTKYAVGSREDKHQANHTRTPMCMYVPLARFISRQKHHQEGRVG